MRSHQSSQDSLPRGFFEQVKERAIEVAGGAGHADLAGAIARNMSVVFGRLQVSRFTPRGGNGQFGKQEAPLTRKTAATRVHFDVGR
jgi:hypothetical protein